jgi:hypothetical protein
MGVRFADDEDLLKLEPDLDRVFRRRDKNTGAVIHDWGIQHDLAMEDIERRFRSKRTTGDVFDIGRVGQRSRDHLKRAAACLALHYIFVAADTGSDASGWMARKAAHYYERADAIMTAEAAAIDYDLSNDGMIDTQEQQQPLGVNRIVRG